MQMISLMECNPRFGIVQELHNRWWGLMIRSAVSILRLQALMLQNVSIWPGGVWMMAVHWPCGIVTTLLTSNTGTRQTLFRLLLRLQCLIQQSATSNPEKQVSALIFLTVMFKVGRHCGFGIAVGKMPKNGNSKMAILFPQL